MRIVEVPLSPKDQFYKAGLEESHYRIEYLRPVVRVVRDELGKMVGIQETEVPTLTLGSYATPEAALVQIERMYQVGL